MLYGANLGEPVRELPLAEALRADAQAKGFDLQGYQFRAAKEQTRAPRLVKIGLIQHKIVLPTDAGFLQQAQVEGRERASARMGAHAHTPGAPGSAKVHCATRTLPRRSSGSAWA